MKGAVVNWLNKSSREGIRSNPEAINRPVSPSKTSASSPLVTTTTGI
ncbi:hypothetical protein [Desulfosarcina cetonica]|nr:hypothetical protein [Desulfosarcina cetonica]